MSELKKSQPKHNDKSNELVRLNKNAVNEPKQLATNQQKAVKIAEKTVEKENLLARYSVVYFAFFILFPR